MRSPSRTRRHESRSPRTRPQGRDRAAREHRRPAVTGTAARGDADRRDRHLDRQRQRLQLPVAARRRPTWSTSPAPPPPTYTLTVADVGADLRVSSPPPTPTRPPPPASTATAASPSAPPVNTVRPTSPAPPGAGRRLTGTAGTWAGSATPYSTSGSASDGSTANITGATAVTYTLTPADVGASVRVCWSPPPTPTAAADRAPRPATVASATPVNTIVPVIAGTAAARRHADRDGRHLERHRQRLPPTSGSAGNGRLRRHRGRHEVDLRPVRRRRRRTVRVHVTATNPDGVDRRQLRRDRDRRRAAPVNTVVPVVTGAAAAHHDADRGAGHLERAQATPTPTSGSATRAPASPTSPAPRPPATRSRRRPRRHAARQVTATNVDAAVPAVSAATAAVTTALPGHRPRPRRRGHAEDRPER